jgi:hypothetical protein
VHLPAQDGYRRIRGPALRATPRSLCRLRWRRVHACAPRTVLCMEIACRANSHIRCRHLTSCIALFSSVCIAAAGVALGSATIAKAKADHDATLPPKQPHELTPEELRNGVPKCPPVRGPASSCPSSPSSSSLPLAVVSSCLCLWASWKVCCIPVSQKD